VEAGVTFSELVNGVRRDLVICATGQPQLFTGADRRHARLFDAQFVHPLVHRQFGMPAPASWRARQGAIASVL
jgi:hypothetical protein